MSKSDRYKANDAEAHAEELPTEVPLSPDPDDALDAMVMTGEGAPEGIGEPIVTDGYPVGTWFYYGTEYIGVRYPGEIRIARMEKRHDH